MIQELKESIKNGNTILFIGAGISATLGLPTWSKLIDKIAADLGYDTEIFKQYGDNLTLAEYYYIKKGRIGELRSWMDQNWNVEEQKIKESSIYESIVNLNFPLIYTTNYDQCLETAFRAWDKKYKKIVGVDDLVDIEEGIPQIIKFHGDTITDDSIVFVGYSLSDINIRYLLYKLDQIWKNSNTNKRPTSYIFLPTPNPIQEEVLKNRGIIPIVGSGINKAESTEEFLKSLL